LLEPEAAAVVWKASAEPLILLSEFDRVSLEPTSKVPDPLSGLTVTVALLVAVPPVPLHDKVYVVLLAGLTDCEPLMAVELVQAEGVVAEQDVALVVLQVRVELWPAEIAAGAAVSLTVGAGLGDIVTVPPAVELKPGKIPVLVVELARPVPPVNARFAVPEVAVAVKCSTATIWSPVTPPTWALARLIAPLLPVLCACMENALVE
jgi:hypothetical protein